MWIRPRRSRGMGALRRGGRAGLQGAGPPSPVDVGRDQQRHGRGLAFVAVVLDEFSRRVIGWALGAQLTATLVQAALQQSLAARLRQRIGCTTRIGAVPMRATDTGLAWRRRACRAACAGTATATTMRWSSASCGPARWSARTTGGRGSSRRPRATWPGASRCFPTGCAGTRRWGTSVRWGTKCRKWLNSLSTQVGDLKPGRQPGRAAGGWRPAPSRRPGGP